MNVNDLIIFVTHKMTHRIINGKTPEELHLLMKNHGNPATRNFQDNKLGPIPRSISSTTKLQMTFRYRAYGYNNLPGNLTLIKSKVKFKNKLKLHMLKL